MTIPEVNLRELTFSAPGRKERAYKADEVDAVLSDVQDTLDSARSQENQSAGDNEVSEEVVGQLKASNIALNQEIESLIASNADLEDQNQELRSRVTELEGALTNAHTPTPVAPSKDDVAPEVTHASQLIERAHAIASDHIAEAKVLAASIVSDKEKELLEVQTEVNTLTAYRESIVEDLSNFLNETIETVNEYKGTPAVPTATFTAPELTEVPAVDEPVLDAPVVEEPAFETPVVEEDQFANELSFDQEEVFEILPPVAEDAENLVTDEDLAPEVEELIFDLTNAEPASEELEHDNVTSPAESATYDLVYDPVEPVSHSAQSSDASSDAPLPETDSAFGVADYDVAPSADEAPTELPSFDAVVAGDVDYLDQPVDVDYDFTDDDFNLEDDSEK